MKTLEQKKAFMERQHDNIKDILNDFRDAFPIQNPDDPDKMSRGAGALILTFVNHESQVISYDGIVGTTDELVTNILNKVMVEPDFANIMLGVTKVLNKMITSMGMDRLIHIIEEEAKNNKK